MFAFFRAEPAGEAESVRKTCCTGWSCQANRRREALFFFYTRRALFFFYRREKKKRGLQKNFCFFRKRNGGRIRSRPRSGRKEPRAQRGNSSRRFESGKNARQRSRQNNIAPAYAVSEKVFDSVGITEWNRKRWRLK